MSTEVLLYDQSTGSPFSWTPDFTGEVLVECVGAGGPARGAPSLQGGSGGGGGGAYARKILTVTAGVTYTITVPPSVAGGNYNQNASANGSPAIFAQGATQLVLAQGGIRSTGTGGGAGGQASGSIGDVKTSGGTGSNGSGLDGGVGGVGAAPLGASGGAGGVSGDVAGKPGGNPGGGGGGGRNANGGNGGAGGRGVVKISYFHEKGYVAQDGEARPVIDMFYKVAGVMKPVKNVYRVESGVAVPTFRITADPPVYEKEMPTYLPTGTESLYDKETGAYNFNTGNSNRLKTSLLGAGSANANFFWIGDSFGEGFTSLSGTFPFYTVEADRLNACPIIMRDELAEELGVPVGGTGFVRAKSLQQYYDDRWDGSQSWTGPGHYISTNSAQNTFTSDLPGTRVRVYGYDRKPMRVTIDGTVVGTIGGGDTLTPFATEYTGLANTTHVLNVRPNVNLQSVGLRGAEVYNPTGIRLHNLPQDGSSVLGTGQAAWADVSSGYDNQLPTYIDDAQNLGVDPDCVFIELGGNDMQGAEPFTPDYEGIMDGLSFIGSQFPNSDIVLVMLGKGPDSHWVEDFVPFWEGMTQLAIDEDWPLIDVRQIMGTYTQFAGAGYSGDSYGHPNVAGHAFLGRAMARAILVGLGL